MFQVSVSDARWAYKVNELARKPSTDLRETAKRGLPSCSAEHRGKVRRGLRILARMIARAHLRRQAARSAAAPRPPTEGEEGD